MRKLYLCIYFLFSILNATTLRSAEIPNLLDKDTQAMFELSKENQFENVWDVYLSANQEDKLILTNWFDKEIQEVLSEYPKLKNATNLGGGINEPLKSEGENLTIVIKQTGNNSNSGLVATEEEAYELNNLFGQHQIPNTKVIEYGDIDIMGQLYVEKSAPYGMLYVGKHPNMTIFQSLIENPDFHGGNLMITSEGNKVFIDHEQAMFWTDDFDIDQFRVEDFYELFTSREQWETFNTVAPEDLPKFGKRVENGVAQIKNNMNKLIQESGGEDIFFYQAREHNIKIKNELSNEYKKRPRTIKEFKRQFQCNP